MTLTDVILIILAFPLGWIGGVLLHKLLSRD